MSWLFSRALVEEFSAGTCWDGGACAPLNVMPTRRPFWHSDKMMDVCLRSPFGLTWRALTDERGEALLTWFRAGFRARTSARPARGLESRESGADCGRSLPGSLARWDRDSCSWRTHQFSLLGGLELFSATWPRWGMMSNGECWEQRTPSGILAIRARITSGSGSGCGAHWPTPRASANENRQTKLSPSQMAGTHGLSLCAVVNARQVAPQRFVTPTKTDVSNRMPGQCVIETKSGIPRHVNAVGVQSQMRLSQQIQRMMTPTVQDAHGRTHHNQRDGSKRESLLGQVRMPTPTKGDSKQLGNPEKWRKRQEEKAKQGINLHYPLNIAVKETSTAGGALNPTWVEWLMGWPLGWTDLQPLEMGRFRQWCGWQSRRWGGGRNFTPREVRKPQR